jgi:hypothetical protein
MRDWLFASTVLATMACGSGPAVLPDPSPWVANEMIDPRTQRSLRSALPWNLAFAFDVELTRPLSGAEREALVAAQMQIEGEGNALRIWIVPVQVETLLQRAPVRFVHCSVGRAPAPQSQQWIERVDGDTFHRWRSSDDCWWSGYLTVEAPLTPEQRAQVEALDVRFTAYEHGSSMLVQMPHDALPALVQLPFVQRFVTPPLNHPTSE